MRKRGYYLTAYLRSKLWFTKVFGASQTPKAARAVGNVLKKNSYPIFIPCHRVVKSNNKLGGYSLGEDIKNVKLSEIFWLGYIPVKWRPQNKK